MLSPDARLEYTNSYAAKTFGSPSDELVGRGLEEFFPPDVVVGMRRSIIKVCTTGEPVDTERLREFSTGPPRWFSTRLVPIKDAEGNVTSVLGVSRDVTERKRLEERVKQTEKLESVGRLAGGVAHDFNNLLTSIIGFATLVQDKLPSGDERLDDIREVLAAANKGAGLTRQLLMLARQEPPKLTTVDICVSLKTIERLLHRTIGENIHLTMTIPSQSLYVLADPVQLDQIIFIPFGELPTVAREYITLLASLEFQNDTLGDDAIDRFLEKRVATALVDLKKKEAWTGHANVLTGDPRTFQTVTRRGH